MLHRAVLFIRCGQQLRGMAVIVLPAMKAAQHRMQRICLTVALSAALIAQSWSLARRAVLHKSANR